MIEGQLAAPFWVYQEGASRTVASAATRSPLGETRSRTGPIISYLWLLFFIFAFNSADTPS